jgi:hypothetical protein
MNSLVLDVKGANASPGADVIMWNRKQQPSKNQLWYLDHQGIIRSALNDFALEARKYKPRQAMRDTCEIMKAV